MDVILKFADDYVLDSVWAWALPALPRSISDSSVASYRTAAGVGASSKVASPSSSAISNLTASLARSWSSTRSAATSDSVAGQVMDAAADWESLKGVCAWSRDNIIR